MLEVENYFYTEMEFYGVNCAIQYKTPSFTSIFEVIFMWILKETFLSYLNTQVWVKVKQYLHKIIHQVSLFQTWKHLNLTMMIISILLNYQNNSKHNWVSNQIHFPIQNNWSLVYPWSGTSFYCTSFKLSVNPIMNWKYKSAQFVSSLITNHYVM